MPRSTTPELRSHRFHRCWLGAGIGLKPRFSMPLQIKSLRIRIWLRVW